MDEQRTEEADRTATPDVKPVARRTYEKPVVQTERATDLVVLAASSGCGDSAISEEEGCGFLV